MRTKRKPATKANPCPVCDGNHKCSIGDDRSIFCGRIHGDAPGFKRLGKTTCETWSIFRALDDPLLGKPDERPDDGVDLSDLDANAKRWADTFAQHEKAMTPKLRNELAAALKLPAWAFFLSDVGWAGDCWTFDERDAHGRIVGINRRYRDGSKRVMPGGKRGLTVRDDWDSGGTIFLVEGASDTLTMRAMGLSVVGRPSNLGGGEHLAELLRGLPIDRPVVVLGENDAKSDGKWPGREGAVSTASRLSESLGRPVGWALPPDGSKDVRQWATANAADSSPDSWAAMGETFAASLTVETMTAPAASTTTSTGDDDFDLAPREPKPIDRAAFMGLAGEIVDAIEPHTEADPVAVLLQLLVSFGSLIGRTAHAMVEGTPHYLNLFAVLVGRSSKARKGTSWDRVHQLVAPCDPSWASDRIATGVSSGEGIIAEVRDGNLAAGDEGVADKRLLILQSEFAGVLRNLERNGNTVSVVLRDAWDGKQLRTLTRNNALRASGAHISLIGHVTDDELKRLLTATDVANGFGNRHLFAHVKRSKLLPEGGGDFDIIPFSDALGKRLAFAQNVGEMRRTQEARELWASVYGVLSGGGPGIAGALCGRAEAQVLRLSCLYALLAGASEVGADHLQAALALWQYCEDSVRVIFGDAGVIADPVAAKILNALKAAPAGLTQTQINDALGGHVPSEKIRAAMRLLLDRGSVRHETSTTLGRDRRTWFAV